MNIISRICITFYISIDLVAIRPVTFHRNEPEIFFLDQNFRKGGSPRIIFMSAMRRFAQHYNFGISNVIDQWLKIFCGLEFMHSVCVEISAHKKSTTFRQCFQNKNQTLLIRARYSPHQPFSSRPNLLLCLWPWVPVAYSCLILVLNYLYLHVLMYYPNYWHQDL